MVLTRRRFLRGFVLFAALLGNGFAAETSEVHVLRVLFVGNSYTYVNDLPALITQLSAGCGYRIEHESVTPGGTTWAKQWADGVALRAIQKQKWDFVVLQEQSERPFLDPQGMLKDARLFRAEIAKTGAKILLYETWAAKANPEEQPKLTKAYTDVARAIGATVVPVGEAWKRAIAQGFILHGPDGRHPDLAGSYLAACVFVQALTGKSVMGLTPLGLRSDAKGSSAATAGALQRIATETWKAQTHLVY